MYLESIVVLRYFCSRPSGSVVIDARSPHFTFVTSTLTSTSSRAVCPSSRITMPTDINNTAVRLPTQCPTDEAIAALTPATGLISITIPAPNNNNDSLDEEEEEEEEGEEEEAGPSTVAIAQKSNTRKRKGPADTIETPSKMKRAFSKKELRKK